MKTAAKPTAKSSVKALLPVALLAVSGAVWSATTSGTLNVTATVSSACVVTTTPVAFGTYNPVSGVPQDGTGSVLVTCTNGTSYGITLDGGFTATPTAREMMKGSDFLPYALYSDSGRTTNWGTSTPVNGTSGGTEIEHTVYGRIPASQTAPAGAYSDTVNVTVTYN